jgi:hypothetical protein
VKATNASPRCSSGHTMKVPNVRHRSTGDATALGHALVPPLPSELSCGAQVFDSRRRLLKTMHKFKSLLTTVEPYPIRKLPLRLEPPVPKLCANPFQGDIGSRRARRLRQRHQHFCVCLVECLSIQELLYFAQYILRTLVAAHDRGAPGGVLPRTCGAAWSINWPRACAVQYSSLRPSMSSNVMSPRWEHKRRYIQLAYRVSCNAATRRE